MSPTFYAYGRAVFFGQECAISMLMGRGDDAYEFARIAFRWAVESGRTTREAHVPAAQEMSR